ncbi:MAG: hypothetical protein ABI650_06025, partial [Dokdonella sp.]
GESDWLRRLADQRALSAATVHTFSSWLLLVGIAGLILAGIAWFRRSAIAVLLFTTVLWAVYGFGLAPALDASSSARELMQSVGKRIGPDAELGMIDWREQNLLQADRPAIDFGFKQPLHAQWNEAVTWALQAPDRRWLFVLDEALSPCVDSAATIDAGKSNRRQWLLVPAKAIIPGCVTPPFGEEEPEE